MELGILMSKKVPRGINFGPTTTCGDHSQPTTVGEQNPNSKRQGKSGELSSSLLFLVVVAGEPIASISRINRIV
jgi:hypothetical protein